MGTAVLIFYVCMNLYAWMISKERYEDLSIWGKIVFWLNLPFFILLLFVMGAVFVLVEIYRNLKGRKTNEEREHNK
jgi:high-affinity nickel permease